MPGDCRDAMITANMITKDGKESRARSQQVTKNTTHDDKDAADM